jgi:hypothetical protein
MNHGLWTTLSPRAESVSATCYLEGEETTSDTIGSYPVGSPTQDT